MGLIFYEPINSSMRMDQVMERVRPTFDVTYRDVFDRTPVIGSTVLYDRYTSNYHNVEHTQPYYKKPFWK
jgi:hypothetical protein